MNGNRSGVNGDSPAAPTGATVRTTSGRGSLRVVLVSRGDLSHIHPFLLSMVARGWDVHLGALSPWQPSVTGVQFHALYSAMRLPKICAYFTAARKLRALADRLQPDVVWAHYASSAGAAVWWSGARPCCITAHGSDILDVSRHWWGRILLRRILPRADLVHTVSPQLADRARQLGVASDRLLSKPFGIDLGAIEYLEPRLHTPARLLCTRNLQYRIHDLPTILRAVAILVTGGTNVRLTVAGRGRLQPELLRLAETLRVADRVDFLGGYAAGQLNELLRQHDIYISATRSDGASLSLLEAMAAGLYPVVADIAANRDWVQPPRGLLFPVATPAALADCVRRALTLVTDFSSSARQNRDLVATAADRDTNMSSILDRVAGEKRGREPLLNIRS